MIEKREEDRFLMIKKRFECPMTRLYLSENVVLQGGAPIAHRLYPLPYYLSANNGILALIRDDGNPCHGHHNLYGDTHNHRNHSHEDYYHIHNYNHSRGRNHTHSPRHSPTTLAQPEPKVRGKPVFYSYHHSLSFVFVYIDVFQIILFKLNIGVI